MTLQFEGVGFGTGTGSGGKIGTVVLVAMGSQPSTPYTVGSKWFYNGKIYTATTTTAHDSGVVPSYDTAYLYNGTYYYWDGSTLQGADESNLVHISGTETITGDKTFSGELKAVTQPIDDASTKAATTEFVKNFDDAKEWTPPSDWIDIRSGALPRSIYLLVGHAADYSSYRYFDFHVRLSDTTHNYKVYIDYQLFGTYASGADVMIDWQTLALTSGKTTTFPTNLVAHVIRIVPENDADTIVEYDNVRYESSGNEAQGVLWAHFTQNELERVRFCTYNQNYQPDLVAVTALDDNLHLTGTNQQEFLGQGQDLYTRRSTYLAKLPTIEVDTISSTNGMFNHAGPLKKIKIKVNGSFIIGTTGTNSSAVCFSGNTEQIEINKPIVTTNIGTNHNQNLALFRASQIKEIPLIDYSKAVNLNFFLANCKNLKPTILDLRDAIYLTRIRMFGASSAFISGLKGLLVSSQAPFDSTAAPQIEVKYTGLDQAALVALFNSLPTVTDSQEIDVTGTTGAGDLTAEDIAIATGKGWTVTR